MAYVNVAEWKPEQVTEWLKGLDNAVGSYIHSFLNNEVNGQQLLNLRPDDLDHLGVHKLGHQELILEAVEHLRNFHYELDRENLQLLALRLSCRARSLYTELLEHTDSLPLTTQTLADVANIITAVKPIVCWLDRSPFSGQQDYHWRKMALLELSLEIATCAQRDRFAERPVEEIRRNCDQLACLADSIIRDIGDPLVLQPASLDLATLKKKAGDDLGFFIMPSFHGVHQIGEIKFSSPAHQCGKIEEGDEVVQVNYQTVVGWQTKKVMFLLEESPTDVFLTLKKRPRHTKVYGQIYMKPYRLPSKKRAAPYTRWHDNLPSPRPELLTIPDFEMPLPRASPKQGPPQPVVMPLLESDTLAGSSSSDEDDDETFLPGTTDLGQASPTSMRLYLPKQRSSVQRRATVTGASPTSKRPPVNIEELWRELRLERQWRGGDAAGGDGDLCQLRDKSASMGNGLASAAVPRPSTCLGIERTARLPKKTLRISTTDLNEVPTSTQSDCEDCRTQTMENKSSCDVAQVFQKPRSPLTPREEIKMVLTSDEGRVFPIKERGRLDKSYSTPAYDLSDCEQTEVVPHVQIKSSDCSSIVSNSDLGSEVAKDNISCEGNQNNVKNSVSESESTEPCESVACESMETDLVEDKETQRIGQILEAINTDLLHHRLREQENAERRKNRNTTEDCAFNVTCEDIQMIDGVEEVDAVKTRHTESLFPEAVVEEDSTIVSVPVCSVENKVTPNSFSEDSVKPIPHPRTLQPNVAATYVNPHVEPCPLPLVNSNIIPPEPPPRPDQPKASKPKIVPRPLGRSVGTSPTAPSPRTLRKRNALLAKRRNVSVRDLGAGDCEAWLLHRCRCGGAGATWLRGWFVLKGTGFYGFKNQHSTRADVMIALPGFTASVAEEVKSKKYAFKVYHTGTVFYFAAETEEERTTWLDSISVMTVLQEPNKSIHSDDVCFSETDEEPDAEAGTETETCFPSPKMRKFAGLLPNTSRSHQNLASDVKTTDAQKKFGSLKKLGRKGVDSGGSSPAHSETSVPSPTSAASLDRKYLRFLGGGRSNVVPVPTAQFRSYRRVPASPQRAVEQQIRIATQKEMKLSPSESSAQLHSSAECVLVQEQETKSSSCTKPQDRLIRATKMSDFRDRQIHASNPSLQLPADMADYRLAAERLREFGIRRNRQREDTSGFVTLEEFMLSRQEEERRSAGAMHNSRHNAHNPVESRTSSDSAGSSSNTRVNRSRGSTNPPVTRRGSFNGTRIRRTNNGNDSAHDMRNREYRGGSPEKLWIDSLRRNDDLPKRQVVPVSQRSLEPTVGWSSSNLKSAAQYQPPPVSQTDEKSRMKLAFEMHLGEKESSKTSSKLRNLFTSSKSPQTTPNLEVPSPVQKTLLGSPRLHRAIFRDKRVSSTKGSTSDSSSSSVTSPISPPFTASWVADGLGDPSAAQIKNVACCINSKTGACIME
ncbi:uncharacterized protein cnk isoform X2 [Anabrus simplex]|uniref:uncharacterized protein cnk isoform X2 n=1 Tax=Anabrus simplex TaxID=316456 RepID=UPI0035A33679